MNGLHDYLAFREQFREAMDPAFYTIGHLDSLMASGRAFMFANDDAAIVVELKNYPGGAKVVCGLIAAGDIEAIKHLIERAEEWGRLNHCTHGMIESRPGWERAMKAHGYRPFQISIVKEL